MAVVVGRLAGVSVTCAGNTIGDAFTVGSAVGFSFIAPQSLKITATNKMMKYFFIPTLSPFTKSCNLPGKG